MVSEPYVFGTSMHCANLPVKRVMHLLVALFARTRCTITGETLIDRAYKSKACKAISKYCLQVTYTALTCPRTSQKQVRIANCGLCALECIAYAFVSVQRVLPWLELQLRTSSGPRHQQQLFVSKLSAKRRTTMNSKIGPPPTKFGPSNCFSLRQRKNCSKLLQTATHQVERLTRSCYSVHIAVRYVDFPQIPALSVVLVQPATYLAWY